MAVSTTPDANIDDVTSWARVRLVAPEAKNSPALIDIVDNNARRTANVVSPFRS